MNRYVFWLTCFAGLTPMFGQTVVLSPGANVQASVDSAAAGATLALNAGTYTLSGTLTIAKTLTLISNTPGARPVLQFPGGTIVGIDVKASNVTLEHAPDYRSHLGRVCRQPWHYSAIQRDAPQSRHQCRAGKQCRTRYLRGRCLERRSRFEYDRSRSGYGHHHRCGEHQCHRY